MYSVGPMKLARARHMALAVSFAGFGAGLPAAARAFSEPRSYYDSAAEGGGGGRWFTGSPAEGYACSACHTGGPSQPLHIEGLPGDGYVPGASYDLRIAWPEFAARAQILAQTPGAPGASMGLVAEFVTETGLGAGTIEIAAPAAAVPGELCSFPPDVRAAQLYLVKSGEPVDEQETRCEASELEERCLLAVADCGAQELRFRWTAPDSWQRSIWFSTGFVATEVSSDSPEADAVTERAIPLHPAASDSERYESRLAGGCSAGGRRLATSSRNDAGWALACMAALALRGRATRPRERR
jgi:hypothetical protein